jgi:hypothetical protein
MNAQTLTVAGTSFELTLTPVAGGWHWLAARPGKIVLSGEAPSETEARRVARDTAAAWTELAAADEPDWRRGAA